MKNYFSDIKNIVYSKCVEWNDFNNKSILITGASGMIGRCITDLLMCANKEFKLAVKVYVLVRNREKAEKLFVEYSNNNLFQIIVGDVCDKNLSQKIIKNASGKNVSCENIEDINDKNNYLHIDYIIHAAGYGDPAAFVSDPVGVMMSNLTGTINMLELTKKNNGRMVFISTGEVYGYTGKREAYREENAGILDFNKVRSCYPESKRAAETLCHSYNEQYQTDVSICRPCHIYGQTMTERDSRVIAQFIRNAVKKENIVMKSEGSQIRSMCYVADAAHAILVVLCKGRRGETYNVSNTESSITIKEMAEILTSAAGTKLVIELPSGYEKKGYSASDYQVLDDKKIKALSWSALTEVSVGLKKVVEDLS